MLLRVGGGDPHSGLAPAGSAAPRPNDCRVLIGLSCACSSRGDDTGPWQCRNRHLWCVRRSWCARLRQPAPCVRWHCFVMQLHPFAVDEHRCATHHRRLQHLRLPFLCLDQGRCSWCRGRRGRQILSESYRRRAVRARAVSAGTRGRGAHTGGSSEKMQRYLCLLEA